MFSCHFTSMKSALKPCGPQLKLIPVGMKLGMKLGISDQQYHYSPLNGMRVHHKVPTPPPPPLPPRISSGFPNNLPMPIHTLEWREAL